MLRFHLSIFGMIGVLVANSIAHGQSSILGGVQPLLQEKVRLRGSSVTLSPDGKTMAAVREDKICFWDTAAYKELHTIELPKDVREIAFASNDTVACASIKSVVFVNAFTGKQLRSLEDISINRPPIEGQFVFSPDGNLWATTKLGKDSIVTLRDAISGKILHEFEGDGVALSADSTRVATGNMAGNVWIWDAVSGKKLSQFQSSEIRRGDTRPRPLAFSLDGKTLAVGHNTGVDLIDTVNPSRRVHLSTYVYVPSRGMCCSSSNEDRIYSVSLSPNGVHAAVVTRSSQSGRVEFKLFDMKTKELLHNHIFVNNKGTPVISRSQTTVAFTKDSNSVVASNGYDIVVWDDLTGYAKRQTNYREAKVKMEAIIAESRMQAEAIAREVELKAPYSEGEKLLLEMERKLLEAKSLRFTFEMGEVKGVLEFDEGNRYRTELVSGDSKFVEVSDGKNAPPMGDKDMLIQVICRYGFFRASSIAMYLFGGTSYPKEIEDIYQREKSKLVRISPFGFKAVVKEKLDGRDTLKVEFEYKSCELKDQQITTINNTSIVWLDAKTKLPVRRAFLDKNREPIFEETIRSIEINPKLDSKQFVVPTDK